MLINCVYIELHCGSTRCGVSCMMWIIWAFSLYLANMGGWWRWALVSPDGMMPSWMVSVSAFVNLPLHHKVQKFSSGTGSPGWSRIKGHKTVVVIEHLADRLLRRQLTLACLLLKDQKAAETDEPKPVSLCLLYICSHSRSVDDG